MHSSFHLNYSYFQIGGRQTSVVTMRDKMILDTTQALQTAVYFCPKPMYLGCYTIRYMIHVRDLRTDFIQFKFSVL